MTFIVNVQNASSCKDIPNTSDFKKWAEMAINSLNLPNDTREITIKLVDKKEIQALNAQFRQQDKPTNVLSFPMQGEPIIDDIIAYGDIAMCPSIILEEAYQQNKQPMAHFAHMTIHSLLHLAGFDHQSKREADSMEAKEIALLDTLGYPNPYTENEHDNR